MAANHDGLTVTELLLRGNAGDSEAMNRAYSALYPRLYQAASRAIWRHPKGWSVSPTGLVADTYCKLLRLTEKVLSRDHYLALATRVMKQLLVDRSRVRNARERLEPQLSVLLEGLVQTPRMQERLALRQVWARLEKLDPLAARTVWLLRVEGLRLTEVALMQNRPLWKVHADCVFALDWLRKKLEQGRSGQPVG